MTTTLAASDDPRPWPSPGAMLAARYQVGEVIGRGGSSLIYRGKEVGLGRDVALKVLDVRDGTAAEIEQRRKRFYREARLMAQLNVASTVRMYDYGRTTDGLLFLVFEYIEGKTLDDKLKRGPLDAERARSILLQILESVREAHALGFLHRDIKPSNVMLYKRLGQTDGVKVIDFGIAKPVDDTNLDEITTTGQVVGTPHYLAPERIRGQPAGPTSDIFSIGLVTYAMLVGQSPVAHLRGVDALSALSKQRHELPPAVSIDQQMRRVINRMLELDPRQRFQTIDEVLDALDVTLEPVTAERTGQSADELIVFPLDFDPVGGTPVDELTGTTSVHLTLTTASFTTPATSEDDLEATTLYQRRERPEPPPRDAAVDESSNEPSHRVWAVVAIACAVVVLGLGILFVASGSNDAVAPTVQRARADVDRAVRFATMAAEINTQRDEPTEDPAE